MTTTTKTTQTSKTTTKRGSSRFSAEEQAAMRARAAEVRATGRAQDKAAAEAQACLDAIAEMSAHDRDLATKVHALVTTAAPELTPRTWYGMPAYAKDGQVVCYFKAAAKFKTRYATFGFEAAAALDEGTMWPTVFAITELTEADERRLARLVAKAVG
jgi:uncharacterized protein YdhG (YjbR/CyaY superfamily)